MLEIVLYFVLGAIIAIAAIYLVRFFLRRSQKEYQPAKATKFTCADQHVVRSKGEMIIDNWLTEQGIHHEYEKTIHVQGHPIKYDWYLPKANAYVEYWGYYGKAYMARKREKIALYQAGHMALISIEDADLENIYVQLPRKFGKVASEHKHKNEKIETRFCPNCGANLEGRFSK
jgi:predicted nuclease of restriction endonuclease-like RecB superfamily